jgi:GNAT superfamily N-acetyltransferase
MPSPLPFAADSDIDDFVRLFQTRTLPKPQWTHHAHLVVGLWHVLRHPRDMALDLLRDGISQYNESTGVSNTDDQGYHESWTAFFVHALDCYARTRATSHDRLALFNSLASSRLSDKFLSLAFYSRERMMSVIARRQLVEPDVQPLTALHHLLDPAAMSTTPFYIRRAARSDAGDLVRLIIALAEFEELTPPDADAQARLFEDAFGAKPRFEPWLAFADGRREPVAYAIIFETYSSFLALPTLYIEDIFVLPEFRKQGIGGAMLKKIIELARDRNCGRVEWTALDWNVNAQQVYEQKLGAKPLKEWLLYRMTQKEIHNYLSQSSPEHP